jgi:serine/threonine protein kinase
MLDDVVDTTALTSLSGMADLSATTVAGRYRLGAPLGQGAMANVYRARDLRLNRDVAVKLFHPGQDTAVRVRFGAEAQALARLSHPGLVGIFDAGMTADDRPYLVMQLVDGESLRDRLLAGPLAEDEVVALGARLAAGLAHVHGNGVVHRDIKPSNIVLDGQGAPYLADFGIALLLDAARMTGTNEIMGTAAYLSPDQIVGDPVGAPADVYSLGLVLLECLTGELEYPGVSKVESALARLHRPPRMPAGLLPALSELLTAMTARSADDRPTAAQCAARLWAMAQDPGTGRLAAIGRWVRPPAGRVGWHRLALAGSGLAIAIVASAWMLTSLLPRISPNVPVVGDAPGSHTGTTGSGPRAGGPPGSGGMHFGGPAIAAGPGYYTDPGPGTTPANLPPGQSSQGTPNDGGVAFVSSSDGPSTTMTATPATATPLRFGPNPPPSSTTTEPTTTKSHPGHKPTPPPSAS